jgi:signal transduction histidine kinase
MDPALADGIVRALQENRSTTARALVRDRDDVYRSVRVDLDVDGDGRRHELTISVSAAAATSADLAEFAQAAVQRASLPARILSHLNQDLPLKEAVQGVLPDMAAGLGMEAVGVFVRTGERDAELLAAFGPTRRRGFPYLDLDLADPVLGALLQSPRIAQLGGEARPQEALEAVACRRFGRLVIAPAAAGHQVNSLIVLSRRSADPLSVDEADLLVVVCEALGLRVQNRMLSAQSIQSAAVLETSYAVSRAISRSLNLEQTFREIASNAARMVEGSHVLLLELDRVAGDLVCVAASGTPVPGVVGLRLRFQDMGVDRTMLLGRRSVVVEDMVWGAHVGDDLRRKLDMQSAVFLPMFAQGALIGSLVLYSIGRRRRYSEAELTQAEDVAEQAAIAIYNARLYRDLELSQSRIESLLSRMARIREHERQTFANVVHDDIVQSVVGAVYRLEAFRATVPPEALADFDRTVELLRGCIRDARRVIWELRPPVLAGLGLADSLRALADRTDSEGTARVGVNVHDVPGLSQGQTTAIYRIAREAILNARRHAHASHIWLSLWLDESSGSPRVRLRVEDDGVGFEADSFEAEQHYGVVMMEEQAAVVGGELSVVSAPGEGTVVETSIPTSQLARQGV